MSLLESQKILKDKQATLNAVIKLGPDISALETTTKTAVSNAETAVSAATTEYNTAERSCIAAVRAYNQAKSDFDTKCLTATDDTIIYRADAEVQTKTTEVHTATENVSQKKVKKMNADKQYKHAMDAWNAATLAKNNAPNEIARAIRAVEEAKAAVKHAKIVNTWAQGKRKRIIDKDNKEKNLK